MIIIIIKLINPQIRRINIKLQINPQIMRIKWKKILLYKIRKKIKIRMIMLLIMKMNLPNQSNKYKDIKLNIIINLSNHNQKLLKIMIILRVVIDQK